MTALTGADLSLLPFDGMTDLAEADPDVIQQFTAQYLQLSNQAQDSAATLRGTNGGVTWEGEAASAFRAKTGKVPGELDAVDSSYGAAGNAMARYVQETESAQTQIANLLGQLASAKASLEASTVAAAVAAAAASSAQAAVTNPPAGQSQSAAAAASASASAASDNSASAARAAGHAQDDFNGLQAQGRTILDNWISDRQQAMSAIESAAHLAPHESFWEKLIHAIWDAIKAIIKWDIKVVEALFKGLWDTLKAAVELPIAAVKFLEHPSLKALETVGKDFLAAGTVVLSATGVGDALLFAEGGTALAEGASAAVDGAAGTAEGVGSEAGSLLSQGTAKLGDALHSFNVAVDRGVTLGVKGYETNVTFDTVNNGVNLFEDSSDTIQDFKDHDIKGGFEGALLDAAGARGGVLADRGLDHQTGADEAKDQFELLNKLTAKGSGGASRVDTFNALGREDRLKVISAANLTRGRLPAGQSFNQSLNSADFDKLSASAARDMVSAGTKQHVTSAVIDGASDSVKDLINAQMGNGS